MCKQFIFLLLIVLNSFLRAQDVQDQRLAEKIHYEKQGSNYIGFLYVRPDKPIDEKTYLQFKFALEEYEKRNIIFVLLSLNAPGGQIFPAMKIARLLQEFDARTGIPVVTVIYNWALSEGAMLAYSARFIAAAETALMGAAQPAIVGPGVKFVPNKIVWALRNEYESLAKFYGRNPLLAEAMVDADIIVVKRNGQVLQLQNEQQIQPSDQVLVTRGELLTLDAHQLLEFGIADFLLSSTASLRITPGQEEIGEWPATQSPLFKYPFFAGIPYAEIIYYNSWKVGFLSFLTNPLVTSLLLIGLILGFYLDKRHRIFAVCLSVIVLSQFAVGVVHWLEMTIIAIGILFILIRLFSLWGLLVVLLGLLSILLPHNFHFSWNWHQWDLPTMQVMLLLLYYLSAIIIAFAIAILARFIIPRYRKKKGSGQAIMGLAPIKFPPIGSEGEAFTSLRPGGKIQFQFQLYDATTEGGFIDKGEKVIVKKIRENVIIVAKKNLVDT